LLTYNIQSYYDLDKYHPTFSVYHIPTPKGSISSELEPNSTFGAAEPSVALDGDPRKASRLASGGGGGAAAPELAEEAEADKPREDVERVLMVVGSAT